MTDIIHDTLMASETAEASLATARQLEQNTELCLELARRFKRKRPRLIATCARGSSDAAASYAKYLMEIHLRIPVLSHAPSISSVYRSPVRLDDGLFLVISQSGRSPDLLAGMHWARQNGAFVLAVVNEDDSPAAETADLVLPMRAGPERAVAATKSFIASMSALLQLTAHLSPDGRLVDVFQRLPEDLAAGRSLNWERAVAPLASVHNLLTLGRGLGLGIAREAALKCKETACIHAEAFSGAELMHGPLALLESGMPVLMFLQNDPAGASMKTLAELLRDRGTPLFMAEEGPPASFRLPVLPGLDPAVAPLLMIQSFYGLVNRVAVRRGYDPDHPPLLKKVTETL